ncbi:hypothetical protein NQ315_013725 [Exocentrus adspersus]|uniref:Peptidase S1 domain-containing protein n=1 Tax=Exocentrus adspersus TaxID=1586481 RepID=A0AAV8W414_9CUCU|nr:hypothetical protein NQ315_013725 [Exocentrus adspersus]
MFSVINCRCVVLLCFIIQVNLLRIPENPCPNTFHYYKKTSGEIYGEAVIPYDRSNHLQFSVNASLVGYFEKADLKIQLATPPRQIASQPIIKYNIYFPFPDVIPKITQVAYNGHIYCSGPPEPLIPGTPGITNVWASHIYSFSNVLSRDNDHIDNFISSTEESNVISDSDIPVRDPVPIVSSKNNTRSGFDDNPFLNTEVDSGFITVPITNPSNDNNEQCGVANNLILPLITGGVETQEGQYPWLAALFSYNRDKNSYDYRCAANLISNQHVVTAARCVQFYKIQTVKTEDILFVLGKNDLTHWATNGAITRGATRVQCHPYFQENSKSAHGDIAVITLNKPVEISKTIRPVCLWEGSDELDPLVDSRGTLASWGADEKAQKSGQLTVLRANHVEMPIASQFDCLKSDEVFRNLTSEMTFCAGAKDGRGPCVGDSGAGFVIPKDRIFYLRGIASISIATTNKDGTCDLSKYAVFCDVAKFGSWIKSCMKN